MGPPQGRAEGEISKCSTCWQRAHPLIFSYQLKAAFAHTQASPSSPHTELNSRDRGSASVWVFGLTPWLWLALLKRRRLSDLPEDLPVCRLLAWVKAALVFAVRLGTSRVSGTGWEKVHAERRSGILNLVLSYPWPSLFIYFLNEVHNMCGVTLWWLWLSVSLADVTELRFILVWFRDETCPPSGKTCIKSPSKCIVCSFFIAGTEGWGRRS